MKTLASVKKTPTKPVVKSVVRKIPSKPVAKSRRITQVSNDDLKVLTLALVTMAYLSQQVPMIPVASLPQTRPLVEPAYDVLSAMGIDNELLQDPFQEIQKTGVLENNRESYLSLLKIIQVLQKDFQHNTHLAPALLDILNNARLAGNGSSNGLKLLEASTSALGSRELTRLLAKDPRAGDQSQQLPALQALVKKLGGRGYALTVDQRKLWSTKRNTGKVVPLYDEYLALRRQLNDMSKVFIRQWVRANGNDKGLASYENLLKAIKDNKVVVHGLSTGFTGLVDDRGRLYTNEGLLINGTPGGGVIEMNPRYDPKTDTGYVFRAKVPGAITITPYYTMHHKGRGTMEKYAVVGEMEKALPDMRKKWRAILRAGGKDPHNAQFLAAMCLEIIYQTQARIGSEDGATAGKKTYGLTVLRCRHMRVINGGVSFSYEGKTAGKQNHKLFSADGPPVAKIVDLLTQWKESRKPADPLFMTRRGGSLPADYVRQMLKQIGAPEGCTPKKFRTLRGSAMFSEIAAKHPFKPPTVESQVTNWIKREAMAVGKQLGHHSNGKLTSATAIKNYIDPALMLRIYKEAGSIPPKQMLTTLGIPTDSIEGREDG